MIIITSLLPWQNRIMAQRSGCIKEVNLFLFAETVVLENCVVSYIFPVIFPG